MENGKVEIILDKKRYLRFDFNAWCAVEEALGASLQQSGNPLSLGLRGLRATLYGGLLDHDPTITVQQVGDFFDRFDREMIVKKLSEAILAANPKGDDAKSPNVDGLDSGTGKNSDAVPAASV